MKIRKLFRRRVPKLTSRPQFIDLDGRRMYIASIRTTFEYRDGSTRVSLDLVDEATALRANRVWPNSVTVRGEEPTDV